jgi:hypothetical protein
VAAYARGAKHARGAVIGQDIFESGEFASTHGILLEVITLKSCRCHAG